jgi:hypothetical protein
MTNSGGLGSTTARWQRWVDAHPVGGIALVGVIATQMATYCGYVFPAIGLPSIPWPLYNGLLDAGAEPWGSAGSFFVGQSMHFTNGIVFAFLFAFLLHAKLPVKSHLSKGLMYGVILAIISAGLLVPYAYAPRSGFGLFSFYGTDGWKLPFGILVWHLIYGYFLGTLYQPKDDSN